jgi:saxitoxin biosynthesis operon SxtJ-like protein
LRARAGRTHERLVADEVVSGSSNRSFGFTFAIVFTIVALWPLVRGRSVRGWALIAATAFLLATLALPRVLAPLSKLWLKFGLLLHACISPIIMGLVFYTTVTPIGLVRRLLGQDPLRLRFDSVAVTYWIERHPSGPAPDTMPRQF